MSSVGFYSSGSVPDTLNIKEALLIIFNDYSIVPLGGRVQKEEIYTRLRQVFDRYNLREFSFTIEVNPTVSIIPTRQIDWYALQRIMSIPDNTKAPLTLKELCKRLNSKYE